ncbi:MAG: glycosyltransferase family 4 protein [Planctomycetota bacterium]|nr:glycosyltransferase family 4 protein [Planctomycetota bacterium]
MTITVRSAASKRVLLLSEVFPPKTGGSGRWFWEIYSRLHAEDVVIAAGMDSGAVAFDLTHDLDVVRMQLAMQQWGITSLSAMRHYWTIVWKLSNLVRNGNVDIVHCGRCLPEGWMAYALKKLQGVPYISYVHGEDVEAAATSRELSWMVRRVIHNADYLIANSHNTASILTECWQVPSEHIRVVHPGVDTTRFVPAPASAVVRRRLGWKDRTVVLTVGRLQKRKGHDMMIRALRDIRDAVPDVLFAIVGDGQEREFLECLVKTEGVEGHVKFHGEINDRTMVQCYQQCDLFALPNRQVGRDIEGFGMVLLEAQACGRPVLAGKSGGTSETMDIPRTGVVLPCEEPVQIAEQVVELLLNPERLESMGAAGREWAEQEFDWSALSRRAADLFGVRRRVGEDPADIGIANEKEAVILV